jgi:hypothetical protein
MLIIFGRRLQMRYIAYSFVLFLAGIVCSSGFSSMNTNSPATQSGTEQCPGRNCQKRPNWACPNGLSFEKCTHACKWIILTGYMPDKEHEMECGPEIANHSIHLKKIYELMGRINNSCGEQKGQYGVIREQSPCNYFAALVINEIFGIPAFRRSSGSPYYSASEIYDKLYYQDASVMGWVKVGPDDAILKANVGYPVIGVTKGHIAVVVPGAYQYSDSWKESSPQVVAMSLGDEAKGKSPLRCMPCLSSKTFTSKPTYYYYNNYDPFPKSYR